MKRIMALILVLLFVCSSALALQPGFSVYHGSREEKRICITVDDCKDTKTMKQIFDLGQELGVPMTFFTLGYVLLDEDRDIWRAIAESDCEIGNHCYWHNSLPKMSGTSITDTLLHVQERLDEVLGYHYPMQVMRPPYGNIRNESGNSTPTLTAIEKAGYKYAVLWDVSQTDPSKCIHDVQNGSILLFHTLQKDLKCLEVLLPQLIEQGYEFVTVSQMMGLEPIATSTDLYVRDYIKR